MDPESVWVILRGSIISRAERGRHLGMVLRKDAGSKGRRQKTTRWVTFIHVSEVLLVQWQIWLPSSRSEPWEVANLVPRTLHHPPPRANTQTRSSKNRLTWTLKFTLPAPAADGTTRRFSAVPRGYGPSGAHALEGAVRYAYPFDYQHEATTLLPTLTSSPCLITLPNMAPSGLKLLGCTSRIPLEHGFSPVPLASVTARTSTFQATASLLFRPSLSATFVANSRSTNSNPSLMPGKLKMTRNWMLLPLSAVEWSAPNKP